VCNPYHSFLLQVEELQSALALEQNAHQHAVKQYVDALDAKSAMQLQLRDAQQQLLDLSAAHAQLQQQHQELNGHYNTLLGQCKAVSCRQ
jgi:chromosome segregation ATPase